MTYRISATNTQQSNQQVTYDSKPNICPACHHFIEPSPIGYFINKQGILQQVWRCVQDSCRDVFIAYYKQDPQTGLYVFKNSKPATSEDETFSEFVNEISSNFTVIYNQAKSAEESELDQICGCGYRKSLEFLIKDYLIKLNPDDADDIRKEFLGKLIKNRIDNVNIKSISEKAAWLGNDETHYERRWEGKDISDLKQLIKLTISWIELEEQTKKINEEMPDT